MEQTEFQQKLLELTNLAKEKGYCLSTAEVQDFLSALSLTDEQMTLVYEYLIANQVTIAGYEPKSAATDDAEEIPYTKEELNFLQTYQEDLKAFPQLEEKALDALLAQVEEGNDLAKAQATEQFLSKVLELAKAYHGQGLPLEDLVQEGNIGMMLSMETLGLRESNQSASAYIQAEIKQAIEDALEETETVRNAGNQLADKVNKLSDTILQLTEELERQVTIEEVSAFLDMSIDEIEDILKLAGDEMKEE